MRVIPFRTEIPLAAPPDGELRRLLLGDVREEAPMPPVSDVLSALLALAEGRRAKSVLPLGTTPAEVVLVRRGSKVLVSYVVLEGAPIVRALDRPVPLDLALSRCASLAQRAAAADADPISRTLAEKLAERALDVTLCDSVADPEAVRVSGGPRRARAAR